MKIKNYSISKPITGICKQYSITVEDETLNFIAPLIYLQRPKWIKNDVCWEKIVQSVRITLPQGEEIS